MISTNLRIIAIAGSLALLLFIIELVRRRRLKEETAAWRRYSRAVEAVLEGR